MKVAGFVLVFAWAAHAETPIAAKLCDMVGQPGQFQSKLVSVRAEVVVGFEMQALIDGSCPNHGSGSSWTSLNTTVHTTLSLTRGRTTSSIFGRRSLQRFWEYSIRVSASGTNVLARPNSG